jgi:hypothetical protein
LQPLGKKSDTLICFINIRQNQRQFKAGVSVHVRMILSPMVDDADEDILPRCEQKRQAK